MNHINLIGKVSDNLIMIFEENGEKKYIDLHVVTTTSSLSIREDGEQEIIKREVEHPCRLTGRWLGKLSQLSPNLDVAIEGYMFFNGEGEYMVMVNDLIII